MNLATTFVGRKKKDVETAPLDFKTVYEQHFSFAWRSLRGLGVMESAIDDAAQDVFIVVHRKLDTVTEPEKIKSWIFSIVRRVASDHRRSLKRKGTAVEFDDNTTATEVPTPHQNAVSRQTLALVEQFMSKLDDERRAMFILYEIEQLSAAKIAEMLNVNMNTIYSRLKTIRNDLTLFMAKNTAA